MSDNLNEKYNILKYNEKCNEIEENYLNSYISYSTIISIEELSNVTLQNNGLYDVLLDDYTNILINKSKKYIIVNWDYNIKLPSIMSHYTVEPGVHRFLFDGKKFIKIDLNLGDAKPEDVLDGLRFNSNHGIGLNGTMEPTGSIINNNFIQELDDNSKNSYIKNIYDKNFYNLDYNNNRFMNDIVFDYDNSGFIANEDVVVVTSEPDNINSTNNNFMYLYGFNSDITEVKFKNKINLTDGKSYKAINKSYIRIPGVELLYEYYLITNTRDFIFLNKYGNVFAIINHVSSSLPTINTSDNIGIVAAGENIVLIKFNTKTIYSYKVNLINTVKNSITNIENKSEYAPINISDGAVLNLTYSGTLQFNEELKSSSSFDRSHSSGVLNNLSKTTMLSKNTPILDLNKPDINILTNIYNGGNIIYNNSDKSSYQLINVGSNLELYLYKFITKANSGNNTRTIDINNSTVSNKTLIKRYRNENNININTDTKIFKINFSYNKNILVIINKDGRIYIDYDLVNQDNNIKEYEIFSNKGQISDAISRNTNIYIISNNIIRYVPILYNNKLILYRW